MGTPALVCHDAGAAAHAFAWIRNGPGRRRPAYVYAEGPAREFAASAGLELVNSLEEALHLASWALVGTGWQSDLEQKAMRACARVGLPCVAVVDHWVNYVDRFNGLEIRDLPGTVLVTDVEAEILAFEQLPWANVVLWPNFQQDEFIRCLARNKALGYESEPHLLWINEPVRRPGGRISDPLTDSKYAPMVWHALETAARKRSLKRVVIRTHPSQERVSYEPRGLNFDIHDWATVPLCDDVARASLCLGLNSYALYLAAKAGVRTASIASSIGAKSYIPTALVPSLTHA